VREPALLKRSTIYVSLEPCAHYGKTPPCADLIIKKGIPRIVVGCRDPFAKVDGKGIEKLRAAGREVIVGVLEEECLRLNRRFITFHTLRRPFITLKWAESSDEFIDRIRSEEETPTRFSTPLTAMLTHKRRAEHSAILVGERTDRLDHPLLNVRDWYGTSPLRLVADRSRTLQELLTELYNQGKQSLLVEGGARLLQAFIDADLWDEAYIEVAPLQLKEGVKAPRLERGDYTLKKYFGREFREYTRIAP
jgi:diaminohydroxyphosphoribosylaminopyrimidine deaminase/5-amino-6-(5-phosphoribosylamino)uracil reductase